MVSAAWKPGSARERTHQIREAFTSSGVGGNTDTMNGSKTPCVAILLSTFNGKRFLDDQLRSYLAQDHTNWRVYWRDDGSSDGTEALMEAFANGPGLGRCVRVEGSTRFGATGSFFVLLRSALTGPASFFAFSDQDDVWLAEKIANGAATLSSVPSGRAAVYFCGRTLVDAECQVISQVPPPRHPPGFPTALTQNVIPGCCMILNRAAAALIGCSTPPVHTWHDWWSYLVVTAAGGLVMGGDTPGILYRQHEGNLIGENPDFWFRARRALGRGRGPFMANLRNHVAALLALRDKLPPEVRGSLEIIDRGCRGKFRARLRALRIPGFLLRQTRAETLLLRLWFLLG